MFDYGSISDVIVTLSYTALHDDQLAQAVQAGIVARLKSYAQAKGLYRLEPRHGFPDAFYQLLNPPPGQAPSTSITLETRHFPAWLSGQSLHLLQPLVVWPQAVTGQVTPPRSG